MSVEQQNAPWIPTGPPTPMSWDPVTRLWKPTTTVASGPNPNNLIQAASAITPVVVPNNGSSVVLTWTAGSGGYPSGMPVVSSGIQCPQPGAYLVTYAVGLALTGSGLPAGLAVTFGVLVNGALVQNLSVNNFAAGNPAAPGNYTFTYSTMVGIATANEVLGVQFALVPPIGGSNTATLNALSVSTSFQGNAP